MPEILTQAQNLDIARSFSNNSAVTGDRISLTSAHLLRLRLILSFDTDPFPVLVPYPRFAVFDNKGYQILSSTYAGAATGWELEAPSSGRVSWLVDGLNPGFAVITSKHKNELRWSLLGKFGGTVETTVARGQFDYTDVSDDLPDAPPSNDPALSNSLEMFLQFKTQYPHFFTEYVWNSLTGNIQTKFHYTTPAKNVPLFQVGYWFDARDLLERKEILRLSDNTKLVLRYSWNADDTLATIARSAD
jgi:hypothetical protein